MGRHRKNPSHLPPCVYEKHGAFWRVKKGKWERLGTTHSQALVRLAQLIDPTISAQSAGGMMLHALIDAAMPRVLQGRDKKGLAPSTRENYLLAAKQLKAQMFVEDIPARALTTRHILLAQDELQDQPGKFNIWLTTLRGITTWAVQHGELPSDPCNTLKLLTVAPRTRDVSHDEYRAIYRSGSELSQVVQELCYRTAQRIGDVRLISESQLTEQGIYFEQSKTGARVLVEWNPDLVAVVERAKELSGWNAKVRNLKGTRYLLQSRTGPMSYDKLREAFAEAVKASGIEDVRIHDMRAKAAGDVQKAGGSDGLLKAAQLLGHGSNTKTTARHYIRARHKAVTVVQGPKGRKVA